MKHEQFMPREIRGRLESSIYRTSGLDQAQNWRLIRTVFEGDGRNHAKARAYGPAAAAYDAGLSFDADGVPHPRHANIVGWNMGEKHHRKQQALNLVTRFRFELRPPGVPR